MGNALYFLSKDLRGSAILITIYRDRGVGWRQEYLTRVDVTGRSLEVLEEAGKNPQYTPKIFARDFF